MTLRPPLCTTLLVGLAAPGCVPAAPEELLAVTGTADEACGFVPNVQGCPARAPGPDVDDGWCLDPIATRFTHPGAAACYRGYAGNDGRQCCYRADGCLIGDDEQPAAGSPDVVGPATAEQADGTCAWCAAPGRVLLHWFYDVLLGGAPAPDSPDG